MAESNHVSEAGTHGDQVRTTFNRLVDEGEQRTGRTWPSLISTGFVGGLDVGFGVFAMLIVREGTGSPLLGALAFTLGFVALVLAKSELFTENFLVPVAAAVAGHATAGSVVRLWVGTLAANLAGGWMVIALVVTAFPRLEEDAVALGELYPELGIGWVAFASALLAGMMITLMTWMESGAGQMAGKLAAAVGTSFLLAAGPLNHSVVGSLEMFAGLVAGAGYGYGDWLAVLAWATLGNLLGGLGLVTLLRLVQVGRQAVEDERARPVGAPREEPSST